MPAAARKISPESNQDHSTTTVRGAKARAGVAAKAAPSRSTPARKRWHETPPAGRSTPAQRQESSDDWRGLVDHFGGREVAHVELNQDEIEARRVARRRARLRHRPFRLTLLATAMAGAPLALLACLLWMNSNALELSRRDSQLQDKIAAARFDLQNTRSRIAAVNASPQVEQWAKERGWRQATQQDFDDVSKVVTAPVSRNDEGNDAP